MTDVNIVVMGGNLTRAPEIRYTPKGAAITDFGLASNRRYRQGDDVNEEVCFVDVTVFGSTAEAVVKHLDKGRKVLVEGRLQFRSWDTEAGQRRSKLEVVAERVNFLPQGNKNGTGEANDAGDEKRSSRKK